MEVCSQAFRFENITEAGKLELVVDHETIVQCSLVFAGNWQTDLSMLLQSQ